MRRTSYTAPRSLGCLAFVWLIAAPLSAQQGDAAAERVFIGAERLEREGKVSDARNEYDLLVSTFPRTIYAQDALLALARSYRTTNEMERAYVALDKLSSDYPDSPKAAEALVLRGQFQVEEAANRKELDETRTPFRRVPALFGRNEYPALLARVEAKVRHGDVHILLGEPVQAALDFLGAIEEESRSPWMGQAYYGLGRSLMDSQEWVGAADALQSVLAQEDASEDLKAQARIDLAFLHRHWLRPSLGQARWLSSRPLPISGATLKRPLRVAAARDGSVVILDAAQDQAIHVAADGNVLKRASLAQIRDVWWSADGRPFATVNDALVAIDTNERESFTPAGIPIKNLGSGQRGIFRQWFALDRDKKTLWTFDRRGQAKVLSTEAQDFSDLEHAPRGELLILDRKDRSVTRLDMNGDRVGRFSGDWKRPESITADTYGNVYVLDVGEKKIGIHAPDGSRLGEVGPGLPGGGELRSPEDIAIDGLGRLLIADRGQSQVFILE
ncbi:MAG: tetratricopeptide repeat protein [Thermoanaerobaculia bacterium]|nr:tetratricopeptide repeat protein [Thermoanaerobaculia bacterium]